MAVRKILARIFGTEIAARSAKIVRCRGRGVEIRLSNCGAEIEFVGSCDDRIRSRKEIPLLQPTEERAQPWLVP
jgi:hypothetical protein